MNNFFPNEEDFNNFAEQNFPGRISKYCKDKYCFIQAGSNWGDWLHYEFYEGKMQFHIECRGNNWQRIRQCLENDKAKYGLTSEQWGIRKPGRWILNDEINNKENLFACFIKIRNIIEPVLIGIGSNNDLLKDLTYKKAVEYLNKEIIRIPTYQRGRVWRPSQVELLWDSILRGFPIGSLILSESHINGRQNENVYYDLMDGQQRINALKLGFKHNENENENENAMLWIDLNPNKDWDKNSTRKFWVKVTTRAHPWGFQNDDKCTRLSAEQRRVFKSNFDEIKEELYNTKKFVLDNVYPFLSQCPVPMYIIMASVEDENPLLKLKQLVGKVDNSKPWKSLYYKNKPDESVINNILDAAKQTYCNRLSVNLLSEKTILSENGEKEDQETKESLTSLEILFRRINTGGTQISQSELNYSSIKAFWGDGVREKCDKIAKTCMPPQDLAILTFRLAYLLTNKWINSVSISAIREISSNKNSEIKKDDITKLFNEDLESIVSIIDGWLIKDKDKDEDEKWGMPTVMRTDIARKYPDIYLLLMWFAYRALHKKDNANSVSNKELEVYSDSKFIIALSLYLKWFAKDVKSCCSTIYKYSNDKGLSKSTIIISLLECCRLDYVKNIFNMSLPTSIENEIINEDWDISKKEKWFPLWENVKSNIDLLLYAEREFIKTTFSTYDPADIEMWEEYNRPWDFDHIIPTSWVYNKKSGNYRNVVNKFIYIIGNQAAIPFEKNRGKNDSPDWNYYRDLKDKLEDLVIKKEVIDFYINSYSQKNSVEASNQLRCNKKDASCFVKKTYKRTVNIFNNNCLSLLKAINVKLDFNVLSQNHPIIERKKIFEEISSKLKIGSYYIITNENTEREIYSKDEWEWANPWISYEIKTNDEHYVISITSHGRDEQGNLSFEFGLRKNPESFEVDYKFAKENEKKFKELSEKINNLNIYTDNVWWYMCKEYSAKDNKELSDIDAISNEVLLLYNETKPTQKGN